MNFEQTVLAWVAAKRGNDPSLYSNLSIEASPTHAWSEVTIDEFCCYLKFTFAGDEKAYHYMGERETVEFLNEVWQAHNTGSERDK